MNAAWPRRVSLIIAGGLPAIPTPTINAPTGDLARLPADLRPPRQASPFTRRLAQPRRPNRVHGGQPHARPVFRTGRSRSVALHPASQQRSYSSILLRSSPLRRELPPLCLPAFSGARTRTACPRVATTVEKLADEPSALLSIAIRCYVVAG